MDYLRCRIEPDHSWYQVDDHWEVEREYDLIYELLTSEPELNEQTVGLYFKIGTGLKDARRIDFSECTSYTTKEYTGYVYRFRLKDLSEDDFATLKEVRYINIHTGQDIPVNSGYAEYEIDFPPEALEEAKLKKFSSTKYKCMWPQAKDLGDDSPSVAGYGLEFKCCSKENYKNHKADEDFEKYWTPIEGIKAVKLLDDKYWIIKDQDYFNKLEKELPEAVEKTLIASAGMAYVEGQGTTEAFFNPVELGFEKDYYYKFIVYPYIVKGSTFEQTCYLEDCEHDSTCFALTPGSYLAPEGTESNEVKCGGGIIYLNTPNGWKKGSVWMYTSSGWKEASGVYVKTETGWKESI